MEAILLCGFAFHPFPKRVEFQRRHSNIIFRLAIWPLRSDVTLGKLHHLSKVNCTIRKLRMVKVSISHRAAMWMKLADL